MKTRFARKMLSMAMAMSLSASLVAMPGMAADAGMTRAELADAVVKGLGYTATQIQEYAAKPSAFADVAEGSQYEGAINLAYANGLISGTGAGSFSPNAKATQIQAATMLMKAYGVPTSLMTAWPADYEEMGKWSGLMDGVEKDTAVDAADLAKMMANGAEVAEKPVIGIAWSTSDPAAAFEDYNSYKTVVKAAGGIPVEIDQIVNNTVPYGADGYVTDAAVESTGNLIKTHADAVKSNNFAQTNVEDAMTDIDGVFFPGGEDISPSLFTPADPVHPKGEEINATRDISDYTLMAYCLEEDIPTLAACRGEQMMAIVSGAKFCQDIPTLYAEANIPYGDEHRMPPGTPNRDYERHDIVIDKYNSKWMYDIVGSTELKDVSSWHHQAVLDVEGTELTVVASTDVNGIEIIEALERQDKTFFLGLQFHPENDVGLTLYNNTPEETKCDFDTCLQFFETLVDYSADKPVVGITWKSDAQNYAAFKEVIRQAGGIPVEVAQVTSTEVPYVDGKVAAEALEDTGNLKPEYADKIKAGSFDKTNVEAALAAKDVDAMFFTGGEDISPNLFAVPQEEANEGEEINATRDISDYTLMDYCIEKDIPTLAVCRGEQMMSIVSGADFIQDIPNYYEAQGATYGDMHRMPPDAPNRTYARHDVDTLKGASKWYEDIVGTDVLKNVSSWHHQVVKSVEGTDLTVVATAEHNGITFIEAVENQNKTFCLGVQYHPENDCKIALYDKLPENALCDLDTCMNFFEFLLDAAASK